MINLVKGQRVSLDKSIKLAKIGLGWDVNKYNSGNDFDLDASVFLLNDNLKITRDEDFIFYNNTSHPSGAVKHSGDNRTGEGSGDDESIFVDFTKLPENISHIAVVVTIHEAEQRKQNFGQVNNAYIRIAEIDNFQNPKKEKDFLRFDLSEDYSTSTSLLVAEIYKHNGEWKFAAKGDGYSKGLAEFVREYGGEC